MKQKELKPLCIKHIQTLQESGKPIRVKTNPLDTIRNIVGMSLNRYKTKEEQDRLLMSAFNMVYSDGWEKSEPDLYIYSPQKSVHLELKRDESELYRKDGTLRVGRSKSMVHLLNQYEKILELRKMGFSADFCWDFLKFKRWCNYLLNGGQIFYDVQDYKIRQAKAEYDNLLRQDSDSYNEAYYEKSGKKLEVPEKLEDFYAQTYKNFKRRGKL